MISTNGIPVTDAEVKPSCIGKQLIIRAGLLSRGGITVSIGEESTQIDARQLIYAILTAFPTALDKNEIRSP